MSYEILILRCLNEYPGDGKISENKNVLTIYYMLICRVKIKI